MINLRTNQDSSKEADDTRAESDSCNAYLQPPSKGFTPSVAYHDRTTQSMSGRAFRATEPISTSKQSCFLWKRLPSIQGKARDFARNVCRILTKFGKFIGPGFIISVAYIDPGNYSTDVAAGAATRFKLLFIIMMSNIFAIVLQSLAVRLGTITGMNLAEHCRAHLPRWLNFILYIFGEAAIIATDIAEVRLDPVQVTIYGDAKNFPGYWLSYSSQSPFENTPGRRLRYHYRGRPCHPHLLFPNWQHAPAPRL